MKGDIKWPPYSKSDEGLKAFDEMTIYEFDAEIGLETLVQPTSNDQALDFTEIGFAKPAVDKDALILTIDLSFDDFDDSLLDIFSKILGSAGAIPAFSAYSPYLLVAGKLTNLGKDIGNRILDSKPEISLDAKLYFRRAGKIPVKEGKIAIVSEEFASIAKNTYTISDDDKLIDKNSGEEYVGDRPYIILSLDGAPLSNELQEFSPTLASAAQLKRFLSVNDGEDTDADMIIDALKFIDYLKVGFLTTYNIIANAVTLGHYVWFEGRVRKGVFRNWALRFQYRPQKFAMSKSFT